MQHVRRLLTLVLLITCLTLVPEVVQAQDSGGQITHTVQAGENLYRISLRYGTTVTALSQANGITNPNMVYVGQVLIIPTTAVPPVATPMPTTLPGTPAVTPAPTATTPASTAEIVHVVQVGENLHRIALKYNTTSAAIASHNAIANPNLIYVGQSLRIPAAGAPAVTLPAEGGQPAQPGATPAPADVPATPPPSAAANVGFAYGVQVHLPNQDMVMIANSAKNLGIVWVKQQIEWALYEPVQGAINWTPIDEMVDALAAQNFSIMLNVTSAPGWARDSDQEKGPPTDYQTYANFVGALAERYQDRVAAYEIWNEQNLRREWNTPRGISAASYVEMLRLAYTAIKTVDPTIIVVTGGLAPTGFNDGVNAIDDRVYLRQMYASGVAEWSDAIGAHPNGWGNPPDSTCCRNNRPAVPAYDDHPSFFFKDTLQDYREIMVQNGDSGTYIWPTQFGWGSNDALNVAPGVDFSADFAFVSYTSLDEQAQYIVRGYQLGRELGYVGPMFLWNLNFCMVVGVTGEQCMWSLLDPAGNPRPAYMAVETLAK
ncbi:MAG: LysM peptidoglycan-binding domain-containing protein [Chloroflexi bacterium]|nr:LysM peptidoglycan-binding domain-containing protein [Chloroflexota bacterium]